MRFQKIRLTNTGYSWEMEKTFGGPPGRRLFDRFDGNHVLYLINYYTEINPGTSIRELHLIEQRIREHLPLEAKSGISVFNWIAGELKNIGIQ